MRTTARVRINRTPGPEVTRAKLLQFLDILRRHLQNVVKATGQWRWDMDRSFENWRNAALGVGFTVAVFGAAFAIAFM